MDTESSGVGLSSGRLELHLHRHLSLCTALSTAWLSAASLYRGTWLPWGAAGPWALLVTGSSLENLEEASFFSSSLMHIREHSTRSRWAIGHPLDQRPVGSVCTLRSQGHWFAQLVVEWKDCESPSGGRRGTLRKGNLRWVSSGGRLSTNTCDLSHILLKYQQGDSATHWGQY